jgi:CheY-like chemotaxis protein
MDLSKKTIMLIDDDEIVRRLMTRVFEKAGARVQNCTSVKVSLETLKNGLPDLIILDLSMPELDGFAFLQLRHLNKTLAAIPVIVISGTKRAGHIQRALELGAGQFIEKPIEVHKLLQKISYLFSSRPEISFKFQESDMPQVQAQISGEIVGHSTSHFKIESQVRFGHDRSVQVDPEDYLRQTGSAVICVVEPQAVEFQNDFFRSTLKVTGLDAESRKLFEQWQKTLKK